MTKKQKWDERNIILSGRSLTSNEGTASRPTPLVQSESLARIGARSELNAICCHTTSKSASKFSWLDAFEKIPYLVLLSTYYPYEAIIVWCRSNRSQNLAILEMNALI